MTRLLRKRWTGSTTTSKESVGLVAGVEPVPGRVTGQTARRLVHELPAAPTRCNRPAFGLRSRQPCFSPWLTAFGVVVRHRPAECHSAAATAVRRHGLLPDDRIVGYRCAMVGSDSHRAPHACRRRRPADVSARRRRPAAFAALDGPIRRRRAAFRHTVIAGAVAVEVFTNGIIKWGIRDARELQTWNPRLRFLEQSSTLRGYQKIPSTAVRLIYALMWATASRNYDMLNRFEY